MEFKCTHTANVSEDNDATKMMKVLRSLALHPERFNSPYNMQRKDWTDWKDWKEAINKGGCIICSVLRRITDNSGKDVSGGASSNVNGSAVIAVETPCLQKRNDSVHEVSFNVKSEDNRMEGNNENSEVTEEDSHQNNTNKIDDNCEKSDNASVESNGRGKAQQKEDRGGTYISLSEILKCQCMDSIDSSDTFRSTLKQIFNFWFEKSPENVMKKNSPIRTVRVRSSASMGAPLLYQVYEWVFQQPGSVLVIPICRLDDLKLLLQQSYGFSLTRSDDSSSATFCAYVHKDFDTDPSLLSIPSITWVNNTVLNVRKFTGDIPKETAVQQSGSNEMNVLANSKKNTRRNRRKENKRKYENISDCGKNTSLESSACLHVQKSTGDIPIETVVQQSVSNEMNDGANGKKNKKKNKRKPKSRNNTAVQQSGSNEMNDEAKGKSHEKQNRRKPKSRKSNHENIRDSGNNT